MLDSRAGWQTSGLGLYGHFQHVLGFLCCIRTNVRLDECEKWADKDGIGPLHAELEVVQVDYKGRQHVGAMPVRSRDNRADGMGAGY